LWRFKYLLLTISILVVASHTSASSNITVNNDIYDLLLHLEAKGVIQSGLLTTRPLSRKEVFRLILEAERNSEGKGLVIQQLINALKDKFKDEIEEIKYNIDLYGKYIYSNSNNTEELAYNNDGDNYKKGSNFRLGFTSGAEVRWFSFHLNPEIRYSDSDTDLTIKRAYGSLNFLGLELELGKDSQWWGPGYHGSLLVSNNPEPLTILKLTNPQPVILPSIFKYLGIFKFTIFATRLEKDREISSPYLWGIRINFKPNPYLELGFQRTALLGGKGQSQDSKTWLNSFTGRGENETGRGAGDQRAGVDLKATLPFSWQPLQIYAEADGEDEAGGLPTKWAYLTGLYLPRIFDYERFSFRTEYATNHIKDHPNIWYSHSIYKSGYTYKGNIIGHHMGTDSSDIFFEMRYLIPKINNGNIAISYDKEKHNLSGKIKEIKKELTLKINLLFKKMVNLKLKIAYSHGRIKNFNNIQGVHKNINILTTEIMYSF
jgi:hypothetical protein